ncbi:hypothetical protein [Methanobrevibacter sp.]|uniref:hypothetical protein n=1 Tax=Methanobrevibacter sp. TaxID=66852 RepID=UPI003D7ECC47
MFTKEIKSIVVNITDTLIVVNITDTLIVVNITDSKLFDFIRNNLILFLAITKYIHNLVIS